VPDLKQVKHSAAQVQFRKVSRYFSQELFGSPDKPRSSRGPYQVFPPTRRRPTGKAGLAQDRGHCRSLSPPSRTSPRNMTRTPEFYKFTLGIDDKMS